ncbi:MAG: hypothetical protein E7211_21170 [Clostridium lundense]|nr:hypothetical protein [Clostridium lundense]
MSATATRAAWVEISRAIRQSTPQRGTVMSCECASCRHDGGLLTVDFATVEATTLPFTDCRIVIPIKELCEEAAENPRRAMTYIGREIRFIPLCGNESSRIVVGSCLCALKRGKKAQA